MKETESLWFVGVDTKKRNFTDLFIRAYPTRLWKNPKPYQLVPRRILATFMDMSDEEGVRYKPKIRLIHIFSEEESAMLDVLLKNATVFGNYDAETRCYELMKRLVFCGIKALDRDRVFTGEPGNPLLPG